MNRNVLTAELEAAHDAHQLPKPCPRCYQFDRARPGGEFQMYRCARCVAATQAAQLTLWRAQWRILNRHRKAIVEVTRGDRLDVAWLTQRMHHLEVAAKSVAALAVVDTQRA